MKKAWKSTALLLACCALALSVPEKALVLATDSTSATIAEKKDEINQAKEERKKFISYYQIIIIKKKNMIYWNMKKMNMTYGMKKMMDMIFMV